MRPDDQVDAAVAWLEVIERLGQLVPNVFIGISRREDPRIDEDGDHLPPDAHLDEDGRTKMDFEHVHLGVRHGRSSFIS